MTKLDLKKLHRDMFNPPNGRFVEVVVPEISYIMIDGKGDPNTTAAYKTAVEWLYGVSYAMKFAAKNSLSRDYVVPPLGGVDKFEPVSGGGDVDHAEEAFGELVISGCDGAVDF